MLRALRGGCCTQVDIAFQNTGRGKVQICKNKLLSENRMLSFSTFRNHFHVFFFTKHVHFGENVDDDNNQKDEDIAIAITTDNTEHIINQPKKMNHE